MNNVHEAMAHGFAGEFNSFLSRRKVSYYNEMGHPQNGWFANIRRADGDCVRCLIVGKAGVEVPDLKSVRGLNNLILDYCDPCLIDEALRLTRQALALDRAKERRST